MKAGRCIACLFFWSFLLSLANAQQPQYQNDVHWCTSILSIRVIQEAKFSAVYGFDVNSQGKPINIRKVNVPLISKIDTPLTDCIASWRLAQPGNKATAMFRFEYGWIEVSVTNGAFKVSVPARTSGQNSQ